MGNDDEALAVRPPQIVVAPADMRSLEAGSLQGSE